MALSESDALELIALSENIGRLGTQSHYLPDLKRIDLLLQKMNAPVYDASPLYAAFQDAAFELGYIPVYFDNENLRQPFRGPVVILDRASGRFSSARGAYDDFRRAMHVRGIITTHEEIDWQVYRVMPMALQQASPTRRGVTMTSPNYTSTNIVSVIP